MGQDDKKLESLREYARTAVLEKENSEDQNVSNDTTIDRKTEKLNLFSSDVLNETKVEPVHIKQTETIKPAKPAPSNKKLEELKQKIQEKHYELQQEQNDAINEVKEEEIAEEQTQTSEASVEDEVESLYNASLALKPEGEEIIKEELEEHSKDQTKGYKFKFRLLTGVFCCLLAILTGWVIGNAVEIASTGSQIATEVTKGEDYSVNIAKYLSKISKLDNANKDMASPEDGSLLPIEEIIPVTPQPLDEPTEYEHESNWFDKICNWFKNLFGG